LQIQQPISRQTRTNLKIKIGAAGKAQDNENGEHPWSMWAVKGYSTRVVKTNRIRILKMLAICDISDVSLRKNILTP
jgi:hypothetical protein